MLLQILREKTLDLHTASETQINPLRPTFSRADYAHMLLHYLNIHTAVENQFPAAATHVTLNFTARKKAPWLIQDLSALGISSLPSPPPAPPPSTLMGSAAAIFGTLYVIEGSMFGGQVIARHLASRLNLTPDHGLRFFTGYEKQTRPLWQEFCNSAEAYHATHPGDVPQVILAARDTFHWFSAGFPESESA